MQLPFPRLNEIDAAAAAAAAAAVAAAVSYTAAAT